MYIVLKCINYKIFKKLNFIIGKYLLILLRDLWIIFIEYNVVFCKSMCLKL